MDIAEDMKGMTEIEKLDARPRYAPRPTRGEIVAASIADLKVRLRAIASAIRSGER